LPESAFHFFQDRVLRVQVRLLGQVAYGESGAAVDGASIWFFLPGDEAEQSRFTRSVGPHQADLVPRAYLP